ncbi:hypothetical protein D3C77_467440 [compost metagenome]
MEVTADRGVAALLFQTEGDVQVRHETAFLKALAVIGSSTDVGFQVHIGFGGRAHHARRGHFDRLQIHRADLQAWAHLWFPDWVFLGLGQWGDQKQGE